MKLLTLSTALILAPFTAAPAIAQTAVPVTAETDGMSAQAEAPQGKGIRLTRFVKRQQARLMAGDKDGDGRISQGEFTAGRPQGTPTRQFSRLDADRDGFLTVAEVEANLTSRFRRLDANGDGVLAASERPKAGAARQQADADDAEQ